MPDYSFDNLSERAQKAREHHARYVAMLLSSYAHRVKVREALGVTTIGYCGHGRAGKDHAAKYVCEKLRWVYGESNSWLVRPLVGHMAGIDGDQAWNERHANRVFWIHACHALRHPSLDFIVKLSLGAGDVAVGIRGKEELEFVKREGTVALTVWIDNPRVEIDPTVEYAEGDCDLTICNSGSLEAFHAKLDKLCTLLRRA